MVIFFRMIGCLLTSISCAVSDPFIFYSFTYRGFDLALNAVTFSIYFKLFKIKQSFEFPLNFLRFVKNIVNLRSIKL